MPNIADMRRQHDAAEEIAATILARMSDYRGDDDAGPLVRLLHKLNALLRLHFAYEDTVLYPTMIAGSDPEAASLASRFQDEMGALAEQFEDFVRRWSLNAAIAAHFEEFRAEATALLAALGARIELENDLLYPLAERVKQRRAA